MSVTETLDAPVAQSKPFRVLICDDQPDVLEALRLLLKGQGWQAVAVDSPEALYHAIRTEIFDLILVDLNYTRDTTSGAEGIDLLSDPGIAGQRDAGHGDDGVEQFRSGRRGYAARRLRFHPEAVGQ